MKKRFTLGTVLALIMLTAVTSVIIAYLIAKQQFEDGADMLAVQQQELAKYREAREIIHKNYIKTVDDDVLVDGAIRGMVSVLGDEYSYYLDTKEYQAYKDSQGSPSGIGVVAGVSEMGDILIEEVYENSPAWELGLGRSDRILAVDGRSVNRENCLLSITSLAGEENTRVELTVLKASDGSTVDLSLVRRRIDFRAVYSEILSGQNIGLIRVRNFNQNVDRDFRDAIVHLQNAKVDALIIDVRNNPGGQIDVMCPMLSMLLPQDTPLITLRDRNGKEYQRTSTGSDGFDLPMIVLINEGSRSAAEFFAAALHEYDRAKLVGDPTLGKGYAQETVPMEKYKSAIILSIREYFTPHGRSLSGVGLTPDYPVSLSGDVSVYTLPQERDSQLQKAIEVLLS